MGFLELGIALIILYWRRYESLIGWIPMGIKKPAGTGFFDLL